MTIILPHPLQLEKSMGAIAVRQGREMTGASLLAWNTEFIDGKGQPSEHSFTSLGTSLNSDCFAHLATRLVSMQHHYLTTHSQRYKL